MQKLSLIHIYPEQGKNPAFLLSSIVLALPELIEHITHGDPERLLMATVVQMKAGEHDTAEQKRRVFPLLRIGRVGLLRCV